MELLQGLNGEGQTIVMVTPQPHACRTRPSSDPDARRPDRGQPRVSPGLAFVVLLFALSYGAVAFYAWRRPLLGKLALREAVRRPGQTLLVVGGLMVGTATITAGFVAADSVAESTVDAFAFRNFGHVDITVTAGGRFFPRDVARSLADSTAVQSVTDGVSAGIDVPVSAADLDTRQGASRVTLVGFDPAAQEPFGVYTLVAGGETLGADLELDEVLVSRVLAQKLQAQPGDRLRVSLEAAEGARQSVLHVAGIARSEGPGAYTLGSVIFMRLETAQRVVGTNGINVVRVSAPGGVRDSLEAGARAAPIVRDAVASLAVPVSLDVREAKAAEAANATEFTTFIRAMLVGMSALVAAAGAALIVNLIGMLAEERRSRLGVLRALGLRRRGLVWLTVIEGALYSLAAGVVGVGVGVGAGRIVAARFGRAFAAFTGDDVDFQFFFTLDPDTLVAGFAVGTLLTLAVVILAARRTARMTITAAIRDLPEPPPEVAHRRWTGGGRAFLGRAGRCGRHRLGAALSSHCGGYCSDPCDRVARAGPPVAPSPRVADRAGTGGVGIRQRGCGERPGRRRRHVLPRLRDRHADLRLRSDGPCLGEPARHRDGRGAPGPRICRPTRRAAPTARVPGPASAADRAHHRGLRRSHCDAQPVRGVLRHLSAGLRAIRWGLRRTRAVDGLIPDRTPRVDSVECQRHACAANAPMSVRFVPTTSSPPLSGCLCPYMRFRLHSPTTRRCGSSSDRSFTGRIERPGRLWLETPPQW